MLAIMVCQVAQLGSRCFLQLQGKAFVAVAVEGSDGKVVVVIVCSEQAVNVAVITCYLDDILRILCVDG